MINTATNTVIATIPVGVEPNGVSVSPDGGRVYVANAISQNVSVINTASNTVIATIPVGIEPTGVAVSPDGGRVYVVNSVSYNVSVINTATNTVIATIPVGTEPVSVSITPDGGRAYVTNAASGNISVINTATNTVTATIPIGAITYGISVSPEGGRAYVANYGSDNVSVINTATNKVIATIPVGLEPVAFGNFMALVVPGNACTTANDINDLFGQAFDVPQTSGIYNTTGYTAAGDPSAGYECFDDGTLERTIWYAFTGDGSSYRIKTIQCNSTNYITQGDTQIAIYTGDCANPVAVACSEDENFANGLYNANIELLTEAGVTYRMMIDGWKGVSYDAYGEFCLEVTNLTPTGVTSIEQTPIKVHPNPTGGMLHIENADAEKIEVFDSAGQRVLSKAYPGSSLDLQHLPAGLYFLKIFTGGKVVSAKVVLD